MPTSCRSHRCLFFCQPFESSVWTSQVSRWVPEHNGSHDVPGFFQWKPVAYRQPNPVLEDSTSCHHSDPLPQSGETAAAMSGLIRAFYTDPEVFGLNVSFGLAGDPFYNSTKFLSWCVKYPLSINVPWLMGELTLHLSCRTFLAGVGSPPMDSISPLVISMMAVGLGVPLVFVLLGSVYVCTRKTVVATPYQPINWPRHWRPFWNSVVSQWLSDRSKLRDTF